MQDPLEITDADVAAAAAASNRPTTPVMESATRRMVRLDGPVIKLVVVMQRD
jgi:hypothetical protein